MSVDPSSSRPVTTGAPERNAFFADTPSYRVRMTRSGQVAYEVRVDGARSVLVRPPVLITGGAQGQVKEGRRSLVLPCRVIVPEPKNQLLKRRRL